MPHRPPRLPSRRVPALLLAAALATAGGLALAQPAPAVPAAPVPQPSPYAGAGYQSRPIKALSPEQVADLRAGRGMGLALAAELNGWPGPTHVLELAAALGLDGGQRAATERLRAAMAAEAQRLGAELLAEEAALDGAFAGRSITPAALAARLARIGALQGELRAVHLSAHLEQTALLSRAQVAAYARLRGYAGPTAAPAPAGAPATGHGGAGGHGH